MRAEVFQGYNSSSLISVEDTFHNLRGLLQRSLLNKQHVEIRYLMEVQKNATVHKNITNEGYGIKK